MHTFFPNRVLWFKKKKKKIKEPPTPEQLGESNTLALEDSRCLNIYTPVGSYKKTLLPSFLPTPSPFLISVQAR